MQSSEFTRSLDFGSISRKKNCKKNLTKYTEAFQKPKKQKFKTRMRFKNLAREVLDKCIWFNLSHKFSETVEVNFLKIDDYCGFSESQHSKTMTKCINLVHL